jgi:hypothetical protein
VPIEARTARLTILIDPQRKAVFERLCAEENLTPSQVLRRLIRANIETRFGRPSTPGQVDRVGSGGPVGCGVPKRRTSPT